MNARELPLEQPIRQSLPQALAGQLLDLIRSGVLKPGDRLPSETELKDGFKVGRSTVREALNGLVLVGAIEVRHGQGAYVVGQGQTAGDGLDQAVRKSITRELLEAREAVELAIARYAAIRATDDDLAELRALLDTAQAKVDAGERAFDEAARFHLLLAEAAQNEIFSRFIEMILGLLKERGEDLSATAGYERWEVGAHAEVLRAVASGDGEGAQRAMARHLADMRRIHFGGWEQFQADAAAE
jgi:GntR family transcriptional repressor for pyruvate dehydrogenase complex